jgi:hypothetical protein
MTRLLAAQSSSLPNRWCAHSARSSSTSIPHSAHVLISAVATSPAGRTFRRAEAAWSVAATAQLFNPATSPFHPFPRCNVPFWTREADPDRFLRNGPRCLGVTREPLLQPTPAGEEGERSSTDVC